MVEFYVIFFQEPTLITRPAASSGDISANARHDLPEWQILLHHSPENSTLTHPPGRWYQLLQQEW